jgi:3-oxoacyl-[acyl-carrier protein] reductase
MQSGRSILITGANRGIGQAIALDLLAAGEHVATLDRQGLGPGTNRQDKNQPLRLKGDVGSTESVEHAFDQAEQAHGPVEVLVANAGVVRDQLLLRMTDQDFADVVDTNLAGAFRCVRRAVKSMTRLRRGRIVLVGSVIGQTGGVGQANYAASKAGLVGLARAVTRELGRRGVTCNVIAPGFIETDMTAALPPERRDAYKAQIPAARFGTVDDVVAAVRFMASPESGYISGAVIPVDGGLGMGH